MYTGMLIWGSDGSTVLWNMFVVAIINMFMIATVNTLQAAIHLTTYDWLQWCAEVISILYTCTASVYPVEATKWEKEEVIASFWTRMFLL